MSIQLPTSLPTKPDFAGSSWDEFKVWMSDYCRVVEDMFKRIRNDSELGTAQHRILAAAPSTSAIEEGEIVMVDDESSVRRIYTKLNGSLRYVNLT